MRNVYCSRARSCACVRACLCLSLAACPHYCTDPDVTWRNGRGALTVVHYWADLQSVHGFRCYDNIARTRNVSDGLYSLYARLEIATTLALSAEPRSVNVVTAFNEFDYNVHARNRARACCDTCVPRATCVCARSVNGP